MRSSNLKRSFMGNILASVVSRLTNRGPTKSPYCTGFVRRVKAGSTCTLLVSNQRLLVGFDRVGSESTSTDPSRKGTPELYVNRPLTDQPPRTASTKGFTDFMKRRPRPKGNS